MKKIAVLMAAVAVSVMALKVEVDPSIRGIEKIEKGVAIAKKAKKIEDVKPIKLSRLAKTKDGGCNIVYNLKPWKGPYWQEKGTCKMHWVNEEKKPIPYSKVYLYGIETEFSLKSKIGEYYPTKVIIHRKNPCMFLDKDDYGRRWFEKIDAHTVVIYMGLKKREEGINGAAEIYPAEHPNDPDRAWLVIGDNWTCSEVPNVETWKVYRKIGGRWKYTGEGTIKIEP